VPQQAAEERHLKIHIAVSALFTAAVFLTPVNATPINFTAATTLPTAGNYSSPLTLTLSDGAGSITASGYDDMFPNNPSSGTAIAPSSGASQVGLTVQTDRDSKPGLGDDNTNVGQDNGYIAPTDAVVLDFANVHTTASNGSGTGSINQITFNMYEDYSGADYEVYALTSAPSTLNTSGATWALIGSGTMQSGAPLTISTTSLYTYYAIGVTDCALDIQSVDVNYTGTTTTQQTPEPGTFVLAGIALIGVGATMRKRNRKV
jgi:PEP-CTERM motif